MKQKLFYSTLLLAVVTITTQQITPSWLNPWAQKEEPKDYATQLKEKFTGKKKPQTWGEWGKSWFTKQKPTAFETATRNLKETVTGKPQTWGEWGKSWFAKPEPTTFEKVKRALPDAPTLPDTGTLPSVHTPVRMGLNKIGQAIFGVGLGQLGAAEEVARNLAVDQSADLTRINPFLQPLSDFEQILVLNVWLKTLLNNNFELNNISQQSRRINNMLSTVNKKRTKTSQLALVQRASGVVEFAFLTPTVMKSSPTSQVSSVTLVHTMTVAGEFSSVLRDLAGQPLTPEQIQAGAQTAGGLAERAKAATIRKIN